MKYKSQDHGSNLSDIASGQMYVDLQENGFLAPGSTNVSALFNTDGICLFSSTRVELWPLLIAINELPPSMRFARENIIIAGIWQGKGKPPFASFLSAFASEMHELYHGGLKILIDGEHIQVKVAVVCAVMDLLAKCAALNMTQFNGLYACSTCEEPGETATQGKGHSRCYPYRSQDNCVPMRTEENVIESMHEATPTNRQKGFKGVSPLAHVKSLNLVAGIVPDYMHGVLLGIVKTLMYKWFSPTHSRKPFYVGNRIKFISKMLQNIKPPDLIQRLPRNLEAHYQHLKATEFQAWLLFYALPCLIGTLPQKYLEHFAQLSEAIHILLGQKITEQQLDRATTLLDAFYADFSDLYGKGSCGLNVHNAGAHLIYFVKQWGPLWAWSCFGFEDMNSFILQAVHGTGNVTKQVIHFQEAQTLLRKHTPSRNQPGACWTNLKAAENCMIAGAVHPFDGGGNEAYFIQKTGATSLSSLQKVLRIVVGQQKLYSLEYGRMKKKISNVCLTDEGDMVSVQYFLYNKENNMVFAVAKCLIYCDSSLDVLQAGRHLKAVSVDNSDTFSIIDVSAIKEKLFFIDPQPNVSSPFVARIPNLHGHAVFK